MRRGASLRACPLREVSLASLIVILDDRTTNRSIYARLAAAVEADVSVQAFASPTAALRSFAETPPDLVITDFRMPEMDGAEFVRRLRALPSCEDLPVIVITAYENQDFRLRALEAGATDFLQSPIDHHEFATRARNLLRLGQHQKLARSRAETLQRELEESERSRMDAVRGSRERLAQVIDTIPAMISAVNADGQPIFANAGYAEIAGVPSGERPRLLDAVDARVLESGTPAPAFEEVIVDRQGRSRTFLTRKFLMRESPGAAPSVLTTSFDISETKQAESHLRYLAHNDALTDLPNRVMLLARLEEELARTGRGGPGFALHFMDLDRFKNVNDAFGHATGDALLQAVAGRLRDVLRGIDMVARLGGDEFAIFQPETENPGDAASLAARIIEVISKPFLLHDRQICTNASVGITLHPSDGDTSAELLKNADLAMYRAKVGGRGTFHLFTSDIRDRVREAVLLEFDLRQGIDRGELVLHYQPQLDLPTGRIAGVEALVRWRHPQRGLLPPAHFLGMAEESGLVAPMTRWVLRETCAQAARWQHMGLRRRIAVNISSVLFRKEDVRRLVTGALAETGLDPALLEIEITETALMENPEAAANELRELQDMGVRFSIDDFGTGYSSLSRLKLLPVNRLKIDKSFVASLATDRSDIAIVRAIVSIGRSLDLDIIAEGVETADQVRLLRAEGCQEIQGFYVAPPLPAGELELFLREREARLDERPPGPCSALAHHGS